MKLETLENRPLKADEILYRKAFLSDGALWKKPMSYAEYEEYDSQGLIVHTENGHYYRDKSDEQRGVTIMQVDSSSNAAVTLHPRYSYPVLHNHHFVEIVYVVQGSCTNFMKDASFPLKTGDVCILAPNAMHALSCTNDSSCIVNIMVNRKFFDHNFLGYLSGGQLLVNFLEGILYGKTTSPYLLFPTDNDEWLESLAQRMITETVQQPHAYEHSIRLLASEFLLHLVREYEMDAIVPNQASHSQNGLIVAVLGYLHVNYSKTTLTDTAEYFGYSPSYLSRMLRDNTGMTFNAIINQLQMEHAAEMLLAGQKSVTEIAHDVGCFDSSHFNKKFKKYFGILPRYYTEQIRERDSGSGLSSS